MIRIAIVDDEEYSLKKCEDIINNMKLANVQIDLYTDSEFFCKAVLEGKEHYNILILDIDMPKMSGFEIAQKLSENAVDSLIMFYTYHEQYVFQSFAYQPFRYIRKEFAEKELPFALKCAMEKIEVHNSKSIVLQEKGSSVFINSENIMYIEKIGQLLEINLVNQEPVQVRMTIKNIWNMIESSSLYLIDQGTIVNFKYIERVEKNRVIMQDNKILYISRRRYTDFKQDFSKYIGELI